jgi:hypothetical protein
LLVQCLACCNFSSLKPSNRIFFFLWKEFGWNSIIFYGIIFCDPVLRIRIRDPVLFYPRIRIRDPGWSNGRIRDPGSGISKQKLLIAFIPK